eukprot:TRINITY_DN1167_c0_g2_i1.p1 TRINITY_DN1167_c0_g2~~TRINITY_DN1167_c0_g2_i1.p1  ORF type:complete len:107 (+),score=23.56 TRINITY_DN1167_c0_g2_i1:142-462(+)
MSGTLSKKSGNVVYYKAAPVVDEQMDGLVFISFIAGFASVILRNRIGLWISLFLILSSLVNLKKRAEYKQITMNLVMIVMGLVSTYFWGPQSIFSKPAEPAVNASA